MFLIAVKDGATVGSVMCGYEGHRGWINYLAVDPEHRFQGIGRKLMNEAERLLRGAGCPKINLQVRSSNQSVIAFYRAIGFGVDDVISMGKRLQHDTLPDSQTAAMERPGGVLPQGQGLGRRQARD